MRDSNVANAAKESTQGEFSHGLPDLRTLRTPADRQLFGPHAGATGYRCDRPNLMLGQKTGKPVCFGGTDPKLTKMGNPWLIRFRPNDTYSGRVIASYGVGTLGRKNWAIVHSTARHDRPHNAGDSACRWDGGRSSGSHDRHSLGAAIPLSTS
jgi:hypothetical protein